MKSYLYHIREGCKTKILAIDRLKALDIIDKHEYINLGIISSLSLYVAIKTYREFAPYIKVKNEEDLLS